MIEYAGWFNPNAGGMEILIPMLGGLPPPADNRRPHFQAAIADPVTTPLSIHAVALPLMQQFAQRQNTHLYLQGTYAGLDGSSGDTRLFVNIDNGWTEISNGINEQAVQHFTNQVLFRIHIRVLSPGSNIGGIVQTLAHEIAAHGFPFLEVITAYRQAAEGTNAPAAATELDQLLRNPAAAIQPDRQHLDLLLQNGNENNQRYMAIRNQFSENTGIFGLNNFWTGIGSFRAQEQADFDIYRNHVMQRFPEIQVPSWWQ